MIGFVGLSHLGIVSSLSSAAKGFEVMAYDPDKRLCESLSRGQFPIHEPDLTELFSEHRGRLQFTADPSLLTACDLIFFSKDVPTDGNDQSDLTSLNSLIDTVIHPTSEEAIFVILSQVPPGFTRNLRDRLTRQGLKEPKLFYQVETLIFGRAVERALHPEKIIVGFQNPAAALPHAYAQWLAVWNCPMIPMKYESAELAKISVNLALVSSISVANTLAELCEAVGADWSEIIPALKLDKRIGAEAYLNPGLGLSGGNLERDLNTVRRLAAHHGTDSQVVEAWLSNSRYRRDWALRIVHSEVIPKQPNPVIALWGLSYKPQTSSTKNSPALALIEALQSFSIQAYDPHVVLEAGSPFQWEQFKTPLEACKGADVLAIMTAWPEFSDVPLAHLREWMAGRVIIDPFGLLNDTECARLGFQHHRLGSPATGVLKTG